MSDTSTKIQIEKSSITFDLKRIFKLQKIQEFLDLIAISILFVGQFF